MKEVDWARKKQLRRAAELLLARGHKQRGSSWDVATLLRDLFATHVERSLFVTTMIEIVINQMPNGPVTGADFEWLVRFVRAFVKDPDLRAAAEGGMAELLKHDNGAAYAAARAWVP